MKGISMNFRGEGIKMRGCIPKSVAFLWTTAILWGGVTDFYEKIKI
jgi:hypothetical protein